ncbi:hypothetical protein SAMN04487977_101495 [Treponema bryantii]|uniref:Uncharacterized protein n=1 Tax=Treponema bryantii TaxID=163 RepID=A0A1H9AXD4_9SPIR|nr:hypothetical protein [Treponema bryantii]SEP81073.1 hypothetical protein SAMN04487977_101495 [Treponema bryantii]
MKKYKVYVRHGGDVTLVADFYGEGDACMFCMVMNRKEEQAVSDAYYFIGK